MSNQDNEVKEFVFDNAIVRIHPGKCSEEERRDVLEKACIEFYRAIQRSKKNQEKTEA